MSARDGCVEVHAYGIVAAADHSDGEAIHCQSRIESDTKQLDDVAEQHHRHSYTDTACCRKLLSLGSRARTTLLRSWMD